MHTKPFFPQLQRTFVKSLADPEALVRERSVAALGILVPMQTRLDPLVNELISNIGTNVGDVRQAMLQALECTISQGTKSISESVVESARKAIADANQQ